MIPLKGTAQRAQREPAAVKGRANLQCEGPKLHMVRRIGLSFRTTDNDLDKESTTDYHLADQLVDHFCLTSPGGQALLSQGLGSFPKADALQLESRCRTQL